MFRMRLLAGQSLIRMNGRTGRQREEDRMFRMRQLTG
jgi:hypothetical protein